MNSNVNPRATIKVSICADKYRSDEGEEYLLWFAHKGFPEGGLGQLMQLALALKVEGLENLIRPLKEHSKPA